MPHFKSIETGVHQGRGLTVHVIKASRRTETNFDNLIWDHDV